MGYGIAGVVCFLLIYIPIAKIIGKAGYSRWWLLLTFIPVLNLIGLWVFAFGSWPVFDEQRPT